MIRPTDADREYHGGRFSYPATVVRVAARDGLLHWDLTRGQPDVHHAAIRDLAEGLRAVLEEPPKVGRDNWSMTPPTPEAWLDSEVAGNQWHRALRPSCYKSVLRWVFGMFNRDVWDPEEYHRNIAEKYPTATYTVYEGGYHREHMRDTRLVSRSARMALLRAMAQIRRGGVYNPAPGEWTVAVHVEVCNIANPNDWKADYLILDPVAPACTDPNGLHGCPGYCVAMPMRPERQYTCAGTVTYG